MESQLKGLTHCGISGEKFQGVYICSDVRFWSKRKCVAFTSSLERLQKSRRLRSQGLQERLRSVRVWEMRASGTTLCTLQNSVRWDRGNYQRQKAREKGLAFWMFLTGFEKKEKKKKTSRKIVSPVEMHGPCHSCAPGACLLYVGHLASQVSLASIVPSLQLLLGTCV